MLSGPTIGYASRSIGLRGRGQEHIKAYGALPNVEIAALCDVDDNVMRERLPEAQKLGSHPKTYTDIRKVLDDKSIDAISIATPNHWHSLMAIWACQAGKDVYVEKPCSHNLWEGGQLVRAAAKYNRIVQHGTQSRSTPEVMEAIKKVRERPCRRRLSVARSVFQAERYDRPHACIACSRGS